MKISMTILFAALALRAAAFVPSSLLPSRPRTRTLLNVGVAPPPTKEDEAVSGGNNSGENNNLPELGEDGIYKILNKEQHQ